ncbi:MAG: hypothetical protein WCV41_03890 [Patescibacteria group bacterium]
MNFEKNNKEELVFSDQKLQAIADKIKFIKGRDKQDGVITAEGLLEEVKDYVNNLPNINAIPGLTYSQVFEINNKEASRLVKEIMKSYNKFDNADSQKLLEAEKALGVDVEKTKEDIASGKITAI